LGEENLQTRLHLISLAVFAQYTVVLNAQNTCHLTLVAVGHIYALHAGYVAQNDLLATIKR